MEAEKHVFLIPNGVAWCTARLVTKSLGLDDGSVLFVLCRSFDAPESAIQTVRMPFDWGFFPHTLRILKARTALRRFLQWWSGVLGERFHLYLPHLRMPYYQLLAASSKCVSVNYIEEGTAAYYSDEEWRSRAQGTGGWRDWAISWLGYAGGYRRSVGLFAGRQRACFGLNAESFPCRSNKTHIPESFAEISSSAVIEHSVVLAPKGRLSGDWNEDALNEALNALLKYCRTLDVGLVAVKAHPAEGDDGDVAQMCEKKLRAAGFDVCRLGQAVVLEWELSLSDIRLFHMGSSIDLYSRRLRGVPIHMGLLRSDSSACLSKHLQRQPVAARRLVGEALNRASSVLGIEPSGAAGAQ